MADEGRLLGDLPRARPGTRSARRPPRTIRPDRTPGGPAARTAAPAEPGEIASGVLRTAVGATEAGLRVASRITGEVIRRLPKLP